MENTDLEIRIRELEQELNSLKSISHEKSEAYSSSNEASNGRFLAMADFIPAFIAYINAVTLQYEFVNDLYVKSFGLPKEKIIGSHIRNVIGETCYNFALRYINEAKAGNYASYEDNFDLTSGKHWLRVNFSPVFDDNHIVIGIALICIDISDHKKLEAALQDREERFELLFNKAPLGYQSLDFDGNFIEVNQRWIDTLGYTYDEVVGRWFGDFLSPNYQN